MGAAVPHNGLAAVSRVRRPRDRGGKPVAAADSQRHLCPADRLCQAHLPIGAGYCPGAVYRPPGCYDGPGKFYLRRRGASDPERIDHTGFHHNRDRSPIDHHPHGLPGLELLQNAFGMRGAVCGCRRFMLHFPAGLRHGRQQDHQQRVQRLDTHGRLAASALGSKRMVLAGVQLYGGTVCGRRRRPFHRPGQHIPLDVRGSRIFENGAEV